MNSNFQNNLKDNKLLKIYLNYALPSIAAMWVFSIYTMVDGYFVGKYVSEIALASVNVAMPFVNTIFALAIILAVGTSTRVAILLVRKSKRLPRSSLLLRFSLLFAFRYCLRFYPESFCLSSHAS